MNLLFGLIRQLMNSAESMFSEVSIEEEEKARCLHYYLLRGYNLEAI